MKKLLVILLALSFAVLVFVLGGCASENPEPVTPSMPDVTEPAENTEPAATDAENEPDIDDGSEPGAEDEPAAPVSTDCELQYVTVAGRSDENYTAVYDIDCGGEYIENSYLWCDAEMTAFRVVSVEMNDDMSFTQTGVHKQLDSVKPGEAVYLSIELPEVIPHDAIIYTANGAEYIWLIGYNGRDGGLSLSPLEAEQFSAAD